jgi:hypothetical protein
MNTINIPVCSRLINLSTLIVNCSRRWQHRSSFSSYSDWHVVCGIIGSDDKFATFERYSFNCWVNSRIACKAYE